MEKPTDAPSPRAKYDPPAITVYGTVRDLTRSLGRNGRTDGANTGGNRSTAP